MSLGIKTAQGIQRVHSVRVKPTTTAKTVTANGTYTASTDGVDGYSSVTVEVPEGIYMELPLESGGYAGAAVVDQVLEPVVNSQRCRGTNVVYLPAGTYTIGRSATAPNDVQINVTQHYLGENGLMYVFRTRTPGAWYDTPASVTLSEDGYISVLVRRQNNPDISPSDVGGYVTIRKV